MQALFVSANKKLQAYVGIAARKFSILFTFIGSSFQLIWFDVLTFEAFCSYLVPLQWLLFSIKFGINYRFSISKPFLFTFGRSEYLFPVTLWLLGSHATIKVSFFGLQSYSVSILSIDPAALLWLHYSWQSMRQSINHVTYKVFILRTNFAYRKS